MFKLYFLISVKKMVHVSFIDIVMLGLIMLCIALDIIFPCNRYIKVILGIVVLIKLVVIAHYSKKKGEEEEKQLIQSSIQKHIDLSDLTDVAKFVFTYAFPLVENNKYMSSIPSNKFKHYMSIKDQPIVSPNADTLYSIGVLDLRHGSVHIHLPKFKSYYILQFVDMYTRNFGYISSRTESIDGRSNMSHRDVTVRFGSNQHDKIDEIISPTAFCLVLVRIFIEKSSSGHAQAVSEQAAMKITEDDESPYPQKKVLPAYYNAKIGSLDPVSFMNNFKALYKLCSPESTLVDDMIKQVEKNVNDSQVIDGFIKARQELGDNHASCGTEINNWVSSASCLQKESYFTRAVIAWQYIYANNPDEAVYWACYKDKDGNPLDGNNSYVIQMPQVPPCKGFWSLTAYTFDGYLDLSLPKLSIGTNDDLKGVVMIDLRSREHQANLTQSIWLPIPSEKFYLIWRVYWPTGSFIPEPVMLNG